MKYKVLDNYGAVVRSFKTWNEAYKFKTIMQRYDWIIKEF